MRLSDILSKWEFSDFTQIEGFLENKKLECGKQRKINAGKVGLNYFCKKCDDYRTFCSDEELYCLGLHEQLVSIDCVLKCPVCGELVPIWFLVASTDMNKIYSLSPSVRLVGRCEKLSNMVYYSDEFGEYSELLEKARRSFNNGLGAGAIVYLRIVLEQITKQTAIAANIKIEKNYKSLLEKVDKKIHIIPKEFSDNGYRLFSELSEIAHGNADEQLGLKKFEPLHRLVIGVIENVKNNRELMAAISSLGWIHAGGENNEQVG